MELDCSVTPAYTAEQTSYYYFYYYIYSLCFCLNVGNSGRLYSSNCVVVVVRSVELLRPKSRQSFKVTVMTVEPLPN